MRIRLPLGRSLFFVCAFLFALSALFPLRLALDWLALPERGFAAREARGSIWLGALSEAQLGSVALGDLQARLRSLPLFVGRARVDLSRDDDEKPLAGALLISRHAFGVEDLSGTLGLGTAFAPLPLASLDTTDVSVRFADGLCAAAEGSVRASLGGDVAGLTLPSGLSGNARCDEGALLLPLVSQTGLEALNLRIFEDGRYGVEFAVKPADDALRARLIASGFAQTPTGYALSIDGEF
jgi:general secretion pathway protein N